MYKQYNVLINFVTIYICEAHASDEWPIRNKKELCIKQAKTNKERLNIARNFQKNFNFEIPLYVDDINNNFMNEYSVWPVRAYIIDGKSNKISWIMNPRHPGYYDFKDILKQVVNIVAN